MGNKRIRLRKAFTLIEVIISLVIVGMAVYSFVMMEFNTRVALKKIYSRAKALEIASSKLEENLSKSYSALVSTSGVACWIGKFELKNVNRIEECYAQSGIPYLWNVEVTEKKTEKGVLYKSVVSKIYYSQDSTDSKNAYISLPGFVTYPYVHVFGEDLNRNKYVTTDYTVLYSRKVNYRTKKDFMIYYTIGIIVSNGKDIQPLDTILTRCTIKKGGKSFTLSPETRTPILTQPLITNSVTALGIPSGEVEIIIEWRKEATAGTVYAAGGNVVLIAVENI